MKAVAHRLILVTTLLASSCSYALAESAFSVPPEVEFQGRVSASGASRGQPIYAGDEATISGSNLVPGQEVTIWDGDTELTSEPLKADAEGKFSFKLTVPQDAAPGQHYVIVNGENPKASTISRLKVSPKIEPFGADKFEVTASKLVRGLYQAAYSAKNDALFVAAAAGRPPAVESKLLRIDPETLAVDAEVTPAAAPAGGVFAVYGIGVDDTNDTVWVTNTRQNTVAVYKQSDLSLVKQFEPGTATHSRDVVIDEAAGRAYVSAARESEIVVIDTKTLEVANRIEIQSSKRGEAFGAASLALDRESGKLFTVSLTTSELAIIDTASGTVDKVVPVRGAMSAIGVAYDPKTKRAFVAAQGSDTLAIVDTASGETLHSVPVGAGALSVTFDAVSNLAYVSNRGAGTVAVVTPDGELVASLDGGTNPNHVITDGKGRVYAINKSRGEDDPNGDRIARIVPKD